MLYGGEPAVWLNHALPPLKTASTLVTVTGMRVYSTRAGPTFLLGTDPAERWPTGARRMSIGPSCSD